MEEIPKTITINNFVYKYKNELTNNFYSYRFRYRTNCKIIIKINKENISKLINNSHEEIEYTITSTDKLHKCGNQNVSNECEHASAEDEKIKKQKSLELAKNLIFINIEKPLSYHVDNLSKNNILLSKVQIKNILQNMREESFPSNDKYLKDISRIKITLGDIYELKNIPLCHRYVNMLNEKNQVDKYIIFGSVFQFNLIDKCTQFYVDGTFKSCPQTYYQIINLAGYLPDIKSIVPIFMIPTTSKSVCVYNKIFNDIKDILIDNNINININQKK